ncbi:HAD-IA family hydrolase [Clostridium perfringens]|nr:HAD-IA family hydrolase [Clostridium perfringens]
MDGILNYCKEKKVEIIFFDFFDTIVHRKVNPEYVKKIWAKNIIIAFGIEETVENIYNMRISLENYLREQNEKLGFDKEFNYFELIEELYKKLLYNNIIEKEKVQFKHFFDICLSIENNIELKVQYLNTNFINNISTLKEAGFKIGCISDFYLPKDSILKFMEYNNINKYFDFIYVSSEYKLTKNSGRLYELVIKDLEVKNGLMVGDNKYCDINIAKTKGLNTYWIDDKNIKNGYKYQWKNSKNKNRISKELIKISKENCEDSDIFTNYAFTLYLFIARLYNIFVKEGVKDVFFLSREGEFLKKLFDLYQESQIYNKCFTIKTHYLLVSRASTFLASLKELEEEDFGRLFRQYNDISLYDFLYSLTFDKDEIKAIELELNVNGMEKINCFKDSDVFKNLKKNNKFISIYDKKRKEQYNNFMDYLKSFNVNLREDGLNIVDIGWKGTMQDNLREILGDSICINGYYLGLEENVCITNYNKKQGVLFSILSKETLSSYVFSRKNRFYEIVLKASHGRAKAYSYDENGKIKIVLDNDKDVFLYEYYVKKLQRNIINKFNDILKVFSNNHFNHNDFTKDISKIYFKMIYFPTKRSVKNYKNILKYHEESFGVMEVSSLKHSNLKDKIITLGNENLFFIYLKGILKIFEIKYLKYLKRYKI